MQQCEPRCRKSVQAALPACNTPNSVLEHQWSLLEGGELYSKVNRKTDLGVKHTFSDSDVVVAVIVAGLHLTLRHQSSWFDVAHMYVLCCTSLYWIWLHCIVLDCCVMLSYVMSCYARLSYLMLCHVICKLWTVAEMCEYEFFVGIASGFRELWGFQPSNRLLGPGLDNS